MKKGIIFLIGIALAIIITVPIVKAAADYDSYHSILEMTTGSYHVGGNRKYNFPKQRVSMVPTKLEPAGTYGHVYLDIKLYKKGILTYSQVSSTKKVDMTTVGTKYHAEFGENGAGTYRYEFSTGNVGNAYGSFKINPFSMFSFTTT